LAGSTVPADNPVAMAQDDDIELLRELYRMLNDE
jgi:hypothetical protein